MANIQDKLNNIKNALFGKDVRNSIHDGIDAINKEVEGTTQKQNKLGEQFKNLVINEGNSNAEVAASRGSHDWLPDRLDNFDSQLEHIKENINVNVSDYVKGNLEDDTENLRNMFEMFKDKNTTFDFTDLDLVISEGIEITLNAIWNIKGYSSNISLISDSHQPYVLYFSTNKDFKIEGVNINSNFNSNIGLYLRNNSYADNNNLYLYCNVKSVHRKDSTFNYGAGILVKGGFENVYIKSVVKDCYLKEDALVRYSDGIRGIEVSNTDNYVTKNLIIKNGTYINNICMSDNLSNTDDQDGIFYSANAKDIDGNEIITTLKIESGVTVSNCGGRLIKTQNSHSLIQGTFIQSDRPIDKMIDCQYGGGNITNSTFILNNDCCYIFLCGDNPLIDTKRKINKFSNCTIEGSGSVSLGIVGSYVRTESNNPIGDIYINSINANVKSNCLLDFTTISDANFSITDCDLYNLQECLVKVKSRNGNAPNISGRVVNNINHGDLLVPLCVHRIPNFSVGLKTLMSNDNYNFSDTAIGDGTVVYDGYKFQKMRGIDASGYAGEMKHQSLAVGSDEVIKFDLRGTSYYNNNIYFLTLTTQYAKHVAIFSGDKSTGLTPIFVGDGVNISTEVGVETNIANKLNVYIDSDGCINVYNRTGGSTSTRFVSLWSLS